MFKLSLFCVAAVLLIAGQEAHGKMTCKYNNSASPVGESERFMNAVCVWFFFFQGKLPQVQIPDDWITMVDPCTKKMKEQVQEELTAAMTYFAMVSNQFLPFCCIDRLILYYQC